MSDAVPSQESAERLARIIRDYWATRGWYVTTRVEYVEGRHKGNSRTDRYEGHWRIYSDMVNGMPTKRIVKVAA